MCLTDVSAVDDQNEWQSILPIVHLMNKFFGNGFSCLSETMAALFPETMNQHISCSSRPNSSVDR
jgi:hypothetical protein